MLQTINSLSVSGFIAADAIINRYGENTKASFLLSISRPFKAEDGSTVYRSALIPCTAWRKGESASLDLLKKGRNVTVIGRLEPEQWTGADGERHSRLTIAVGKFAETPRVEDDSPASDEKPQPKGSRKKAKEEVPAESPF